MLLSTFKSIASHVRVLSSKSSCSSHTIQQMHNHLSFYSGVSLVNKKLNVNSKSLLSPSNILYLVSNPPPLVNNNTISTTTRLISSSDTTLIKRTMISKVKKQLKQEKQKRYKQMMSERKQERESTNLSSLPKSDLSHDRSIPKLKVMIGEKQTNIIKESSRSNWHTRQRPKNDNNNNRLEVGNDQLSKNREFKKTEYDEKVLQMIQEKKLGRVRVDKPKQGKTKLDVLRDEAKKDIPHYFHSKFKFIGGAKSKESILPESDIPEIAFIGRSNVGKSSIINAITLRGLAKTSDKPGFTQSINWYELGSTLRLVDLPGYGFAFAKQEKSDTWNQLTIEYLTKRKSLKRVFILIDSRHGLKDSDRQLLDILDKENIHTQIILTKTDLVEQIDLAKRFTLISNEIKSYHHLQKPIIMSSSKTYKGIPELDKIIKSFKLFKKPTKIENEKKNTNNQDDVEIDDQPKKQINNNLKRRIKKTNQLKKLVGRKKINKQQ